MDNWNPLIELEAHRAEPVPFWKFAVTLALFVLGIIAGTWSLAAILLSLETPGVWL